MNRIAVSAQEAPAPFSKAKTELLRRLLRQEFRSTAAIHLAPRQVRDGRVLAPAAWAQQRLWFIDHLEAGNNAAYHIALAFRLRGALDVTALRKALSALVQRHEVLRTVFANEAGEPWQQIGIAGSFALPLIDLSAHTETQREALLEREKIDHAQAGFDLGAGPLIRGRLLCMQRDEHVLLLTMHHIVFDGWSIGVLTGEVADLYSAYREGRDNPLAPLPIQYADYAHWQLQQKEVLDRQLEYWVGRLRGVAPQLELPTQRPRAAAAGTLASNSVELILDARLVADLKAFAQRHELTLFMVLYAAWAILLARLSGQEDVAIGTPVANRSRPELEGLIGLFVNTLVLRVAVPRDGTVRELLERVKEATLGAYDHQDVPFGRVVEALQPQRMLGRNPLFQVMFVMNDTPQAGWQLPGMSVTAEDTADNHSPFDLLLSLEERGDEIVGCVDYAAHLFDTEIVQRWTACLPVLLGDMQDRPHACVGDLAILSADERHRITEVFNATQAPYPRHKLIHQLFEEQVVRAPGAIALVHAQGTHTYAQLNCSANRLARYLRQAGVGPGRRVGICVERGPQMVVGLLGVLKAGGAYVPLDPAYPAERLLYMMQDSAPLLVLCGGRGRTVLEATLPSLPHAVSLIDLNADAALWSQESGENLDPVALGLTSRDLAYVIYTSGSTGRPKGIVVAHAGVINLLGWVNRTFEVGAADTLLFVTSICFDLSVYDIFGLLAAGGRIWIADEALINDPQRLASVICGEGITFWDSAPAALQLLVAYLQDLPTRHAPLRLVFNSGDWIPLALPAAIATAFPKARFISLGGATEATVWSNWHEVRQIKSEWRSIPYGRPMQNARYYILDAALQPVPVGVAGDLYIAGDCLAYGYTDAALSAERFIPSPFGNADRLYKTGDLSRFFADGTMEFLGRNDFQVKIRGFRIELGEIEARLLEHPGVSEAVVLAREDVPGDKRLVVYYTAAGVAPTAETLKGHLSGTLAAYMVPAAYVCLPSLPLTPSGKLDRAALPAPDANAYSAREYEEPNGATEIALAEIWCEVLGLERIGARDNFFELGGHSLHGMRLVMKIAERLAVTLSITAVFRFPTIRQMAQVVAAQSEPPPVSKIELSRASPADPVVLEHSHVSGAVALTFTQQFRWSSLQPEELCFRSLTRVSRLLGRLDVGLFEQSVAHVVRRHDALRVRIVAVNGTPVQQVTEIDRYELRHDDLTQWPQDQRLAQLQQRIERLIVEPVDTRRDPLFAAGLLKLDDEEHVLVVALHLMIADGFSMQVLMRDVLTAYAQLSAGGGISLPEIPVQLTDYAALQESTRHAWNQQHSAYWEQRLSGCGRLRFPMQKPQTADRRDAGAVVPVHLDKQLTERLREWCRVQQTTLVMSAFTAFAALVLRWCDASEAVIRYQTNGRADARVHNAIGAFAATLNLRMQLRDEDRFIDLLKRVTEEYCDAAEHADFSAIDARTPRPPFTYNCVFNWVPQSTREEFAAPAGSPGGLQVFTLPFANQLLTRFDTDDEPSILLSDTADGIVGDVYFSLNRHTAAAMQCFVRDFVRFMQIMILQPQQRVGAIALEHFQGDDHAE